MVVTCNDYVDVYNVGEEYYQGGEEELRPEFLCPFCAEDFDIVGLCCHIDEEHAVEAKNGVGSVSSFYCFDPGVQFNSVTTYYLYEICKMKGFLVLADGKFTSCNFMVQCAIGL